MGDAATAPPPGGLRPGLEISGRYRLVAPLGKGGMGEVWEAQHTVIGRTVAIKMLLPNLADAEAASRLQREAEIIAQLEHANIVGVIDFGLVAPGQPFIVMERLCGRTLSAVLRERGPLPWTQARDIAAQIAAGLACAHQVGVVHRDLKPSNVFVLDDPRGRLVIKIIDFGLAKITQLGPGDRALTRSGSVFGTPAYMAPEQARGEPLDGRVDLYALGAILYEMIVGEPLWRRSTIAQLLYCHLFEPAPTIRSRVPEVPADLDALVACCLCKDRTMRPPDTDAVRLALVAAGSGKGATVVPHDSIPVPDPELRARYATAVPDAPVVRSAASRPWLVPVVMGVAATIAVVVGVRLGTRADASVGPNDASIVPVAAPLEPAPVQREPIPVRAEPSVPPPATPPIEAQPSGPSTVPDEPVPGSSAIAVTGDSAPPKAPVRVRPKRGSKDPKSMPEPSTSDPPRSDPPTSEPTPVPKRKGETFEWPTP